MKRFRINTWDGQVAFKAETTQQIYDYLKANPAIVGATIEDVVDDIDWVTEEDFIEAFEEGECPGDLQFF